MHISELERDVENELRGHIECGGDMHYPGDVISEIVDSNVPVYTSDLLELAQSNLWLAVNTPEIIGFDGECTAVNTIAGNVYEHLTARLWEVWDAELQELYDELQE